VGKIGVAKIFESFQGEGQFAGSYTLFIRTSGCSVGCPQCDTDYRRTGWLDMDAVSERIRLFTGKFLWVTGGEPTDWQGVDALAKVAVACGLFPIMATSGVRAVSDCWHTYCSPHRPEQTQLNFHDQINLVPGLNGLSQESCVRYLQEWAYTTAYITPLHGDAESLQVCKDLVRQFTKKDVRLGHQSHKVWEVE
jgi:hypothetical protein